jgi:hypothetical protein
MSAEEYRGQLYLARKTKPKAMHAKDGTFGLQMLAYSKPHGATLVPWRISWFGDDALGFWCHSGTDLAPGAVLQVSLTRLVLIDGGGRNQGPELHAHINRLQVLPKDANSRQEFMTNQAVALAE